MVKQAKQLKCDVNSKQFRDTVRFVWMPRLMEQIQASFRIVPSDSSHGLDQTTLCNTQQTESSTDANPTMFCDNSMVSSYSSEVDLQPLSLSDTSTTSSSESAEKKESISSSLWQQWDYSDLQAFEPCNGFGDADLWTDENIWFLQQHLADHL